MAFLAEHSDVIELIYQAITSGGVDRAAIVAAVKQEMVNASNARMKAELT